MSPVLTDAPVCGCVGCTEPAEFVVEHPEHGHRAVCLDHAADYEEVGRV